MELHHLISARSSVRVRPFRIFAERSSVGRARCFIKTLSPFQTPKRMPNMTTSVKCARHIHKLVASFQFSGECRTRLHPPVAKNHAQRLAESDNSGVPKSVHAQSVFSILSPDFSSFSPLMRAIECSPVRKRGVSDTTKTQARETGDRNGCAIKSLSLSSIARCLLLNVPRARARGYILSPSSTAST